MIPLRMATQLIRWAANYGRRSLAAALRTARLGHSELDGSIAAESSTVKSNWPTARTNETNA